MIDDSGGQQQLAPVFARSVRERHVETIAQASRVHDLAAPHFDALVASDLLTRERMELVRRGAIAREKRVNRGGHVIARAAGIAHEHATPAAAQHERRAQTRGSASHDDDVVHTQLKVESGE